MDRLEILRNNPLFTTLGDDDLVSFSHLFIERNIHKDTIVFQENDRADALYLLIEGKVKVMLNEQHGREVIITVLESGECFGEMGLFDIDIDRRSAQIMTMTPCQLLVLSRDDFLNWLGLNPKMALGFIQQLSQRLRRANTTINNLATLDVQSRVAWVLLKAAQPEGRHLVVAEPLTQQDIAGMVGATRERVNIAMRTLEKKGFLRKEGRRVVILDASK